MKSWKDVKVGDIIYYYDKFKLHPQVVKEAEIKEEEESWYDWKHTKHTRVNRYMNILAGKSKAPFELGEYSIENTSIFYGGMRRFSCEEAANEFVNRLKTDRKNKIKKLSDKLHRYITQFKKYPELLE